MTTTSEVVIKGLGAGSPSSEAPAGEWAAGKVGGSETGQNDAHTRCVNERAAALAAGARFHWGFL